MSQDQEIDVRAAIDKAMEKGTMKKFPHVVQAMNKHDPLTGDLKCLAVLDKICKPGVTDMKLALQKAEIRIKDIENLSFPEIVKLQGELQAKL